MISTLPEAGYTLLEAAKIIRCHPKHIYKIANRGDLQLFLGLDNRLRISREELHSHLKEKKGR